MVNKTAFPNNLNTGPVRENKLKSKEDKKGVYVTPELMTEKTLSLD